MTLKTNPVIPWECKFTSAEEIMQAVLKTFPKLINMWQMMYIQEVEQVKKTTISNFNKHSNPE
jgi:hypothetical protein